MKTDFPSQSETSRKWYVLDASGHVLGRVASQAAKILMGKHRASYVPFLDNGDHVIIVNAQKVRLTGQKEENKIYYRHSGYPGGLRAVTAARMRATHPERLLEHAVRGMLPKTKLGERMYRKLKVYAGEKHHQEAQKPVPMAVAGR